VYRLRSWLADSIAALLLRALILGGIGLTFTSAAGLLLLLLPVELLARHRSRAWLAGDATRERQRDARCRTFRV